MERVLYRIVFLLPYTVFQIYNSADNRPDSKCVCKIARSVVMSLSSNWLFIWDSKHPRTLMLAAFQICSSTCSFEYCMKGCVVLWSFKHFLDLVQKMCRASDTHGVLSSRYGLKQFLQGGDAAALVMILHKCNFFLAHVLKMLRTGMTLDLFDFQQVSPSSAQWKKYNQRELVALVGWINLLNSSCL